VQSVIAPDRLLLELPALETKHQKQLFFWQLRSARVDNVLCRTISFALMQ
jgi:hypothetical protein